MEKERICLRSTMTTPTSLTSSDHPCPFDARGWACTLATVALGLVALTSEKAQAADDRYKVHIRGQKIQVGKTQSVTIQLTADAPWHMNIDYPTSLKFKAASGVTLTKSKFKKTDAQTLSEHKIVFLVPLTATQAGAQTVSGKLKFAICKEDACSPASTPITLRLVATATTKPKSKRRSQKKQRPSSAQTKRVQASKHAVLRYFDSWIYAPIGHPGLDIRFFTPSDSARPSGSE